jgi:hypothetical protein
MFHVAFAVLLLVPVAGQQSTPEQLFEKRIAPIFKSPNPSSCVQPPRLAPRSVSPGEERQSAPVEYTAPSVTGLGGLPPGQS